jgi:DNA-binding LacI/PurR family transcriptional regulator
MPPSRRESNKVALILLDRYVAYCCIQVMKTIYTIHAPEASKLEAVKAEMLKLGAPTIRAVDCGDYLMALEGCHRIAAAHALGIEPEMVIYAQDDEIDITTFDWYDSANWDGTVYQAGEVAGELYTPQARDYSF